MKQVTPVMHQVHKAGEKTFVDYAGMTMPWLETSTGEIHEAQIFVGCLGASQYTFVDATATQKLPDFIGSHVKMWAYFGGVSEIVVPDNLKSAVTKAHRYDPDINLTYQHLSEHYGVAIVPARSAAPKDKAKVENAVLCIERQILAPLRHVTFTSLASLNQAIRERLSVFNQRSFQKMKTSRLVLFETLDKPALKPLPQESYQYADWKHVKINIDYHFVFDEHYYSVPYQYIHHVITIRATDTTIECFYQDKRVATHTRGYARRHGYSTQGTHMPENHAAYAKWTPERIARWASKIGPHTKQFIEYMIASRPFPQQAFRACLGLLRLSTHYTEIRLEKACELGLAAGATRYQQIKTLLERNMDLVPQASSSSTPIILHHDNIRGADYYH
jgi:transposase